MQTLDKSNVSKVTAAAIYVMIYMKKIVRLCIIAWYDVTGLSCGQMEKNIFLNSDSKSNAVCLGLQEVIRF